MASFDRFVETRWAYAALALMVFVLSLPGLIAMPVLDRDEGRFTEASSEMLETGDFVVIRYHEQLRNKKPVGIHWMQAAVVGATVGADARDIAFYRLPSLFGAMLAAMATLWCGGALFTRRAAFIGAMLIGASLLLTTEAHIAKTDAAQCGFLVLGMAALAHMRRGAGKAMGVLFWFCLAVGVLLKGIIAPMVMGFTVFGLLLWERRDGRWNAEWAKPLLNWPGFTLFCMMTIPWFIAVQISTSGEFLFEAAAVDLGQKIVSAAEGHKGPPGIHLAALPLLFWPGTILLVPGVWLAISQLVHMRKNGASAGASLPWDSEEAGAWRFLACWLVPSWIVFEIAPTKLLHYTLPMYPALALMAGAAADRWFSTDQWSWGRWISLALFAAATALLAGLATPSALAALRADAASDFGPVLADRVAFIWSQAWNATGIGLWITVLIILAAGATIYAWWKKSPVGLLGGVLLCALAGGVGYRAVVLPNQSWILSTEASLSALRELCAFPEDSARWRESGCENDPNGFRPPKVIRAISFAEPSLVFELGDKIALPPVSQAVIPPVAADSRPAWLINTGDEEGRQALNDLVAAAASADRCIRFARRYTYNYSNGDPSSLVAVVIEPAGCPSSSAQLPEPRDANEEDAASSILEN